MATSLSRAGETSTISPRPLNCSLVSCTRRTETHTLSLSARRTHARGRREHSAASLRCAMPSVCQVRKLSRKRQCILGSTFGCDFSRDVTEGNLWVSGGCRGTFRCGQAEVRCPYATATNTSWCSCLRPHAVVVKATVHRLFSSIPMPPNTETSPLISSRTCERFQRRWVAHIISSNQSGPRYTRVKSMLAEAGVVVRPIIVDPVRQRKGSARNLTYR